MNTKTDHLPLQCKAVARAALGENARHSGAELVWQCPNHDDRHRSLKVNPRKNTWLCGPCDASGNAWELAAFAALKKDPWKWESQSDSDKHQVRDWLVAHGLLKAGANWKAKGPQRGPCVAEYVYTEADGKPLARKLRFEPGTDGRKKDFSWEHWTGTEWAAGLGNVQTPLYRLPAIKDSSLVILVEGEKDADAGANLSLPTSTSGGVNSWREDHAECLRGKEVVVIADADPPGRVHAEKVAASLHTKVASVMVVEIPTVKDMAEAIEKGATPDFFKALADDAPEWKPAEGSETLHSVFGYVRRFVSLTEAQARVVVLWAAHCHAFEAADRTPYLAITSAEKQSGKTRLLEILRLFVPNPWFTGRVTAAVLVRKINAECPTLLLDESDAAFSGDKEYAEALRGVLNTGYASNGVSSCCVGQGAKTTYQDFSTFSAKAIAGIGKLPDTVADRSVPIRLKRAHRGQAERFREREAERETVPIKAKLAAWCQENLDRLRQGRPAIPTELTDRQADVCEPLLAIADLAGGDWPETASRSLVELCAKAQVEDDSIGVKLLSDIMKAFRPCGDDERPLPQLERIASSDLAKALSEMEDRPWAEWGKLQKPITPTQVARILHRYEIAPRTLRLADGRNLKGYEREQFIDAWESYLPAESLNGAESTRHTVTTRENAGETGLFEPSQSTFCDIPENAVWPNSHAPCDGVTDQ